MFFSRFLKQIQVCSAKKDLRKDHKEEVFLGFQKFILLEPVGLHKLKKQGNKAKKC